MLRKFNGCRHLMSTCKSSVLPKSLLTTVEDARRDDDERSRDSHRHRQVDGTVSYLSSGLMFRSDGGP